MTDLAQRIASLPPKKRELFLRRLNQHAGSVMPPEITPAERKSGALPLAFAQQRLWLLDQLSPGLAAYNLSTHLRLKGALDIQALQRALNEIVRRHESLRTTFSAHAGQPLQIIHPPSPMPLPLTDLGTLPPDARDAEARRLAAEEAQLPFDLSTGPLLRARLLRLSDDEHVALLTMHHIVSDGWSTGVLVRELTALYEAYGRGEESPLEELRIQYGDYAVWQREWMSGEVLEQELGYWREQLEGAPAVLELPTDRVRPAVQSYRGGGESVVLSEGFNEALKALCQREGVTLFMTLLAAFNVLLHRYSHQEDIVVGTPIAGRNRSEIEPLIGFFVNTLALRTRMNGNPKFVELLERVKEATLGAYAHQEMPFEKLVEELEPERSLSHAPLFQVMLVLQNAPREKLKLPQVQLRALAVESNAAKFDLTLSVRGLNRYITMVLEYNTDLFDRTTAKRMLGHLEVLLEAAAANPELRISELPLLTKPEREQILVEWNETAREYGQEGRIHELFETQAQKTPDAVAITYAGEALTYAGLNRRANQLARYLLRLGIVPGAHVGVYMERSLETVVALLAVLKAGGAYVPLDSTYPPQRIAHMIEDAQPEVLLTKRWLTETLAGNVSSIVRMDEDWEKISGESDTNLDLSIASQATAYIIYTSGSTGRPKGVLGHHRAVLNRFQWMWEVYPFGAGEVCCQKTALSFTDSVWEIFGPLLKGVPSVIIPNEDVQDAQALVKTLARENVTRIVLVPSLLQAILDTCDDLQRHLPALKLWVTSGEALSLNVARRFLQSMPHSLLINLYGSSEVTADSTYYEVKEETTLQSVPIGRPLANTEVYVLDAGLQLVPVGVGGELYIGGAGLVHGYHNHPQLTAERFIPHPYGRRPGARLYRTGDVGRYLPNGDIEYLGRVDQQVKIRGHRIEPGEIESILRQRPEVKDCAVVARGNDGELRIVAYVVPREAAGAISNATWRKYLREHLPEYMIPSAFVVLEALPLTPSGKVDRRKLPGLESLGRETADEFILPRTPVEEILGGIFADLLRVERISVNDNFFEHGGHSLLGMRLVSRVREAFGIELPLSRLFEKPTVAGLAKHVESLIAAGGSALLTPIEPVRRDAPLPLSFAQQRLWVIDQMEPGSHVYNMPVAIRLRGRLDVAALEQTLSEITRRHESLRTTFALDGEEPVQVIHPPSPVGLPVENLSKLLEEEREAAARRLAAEEAQTPFDLVRGPLLRAKLLRLNEEDHIALFTMHHIISDGWSMGVLIKEIATLYEAYTTGKPSPLEELQIQYADFAHWQREWLRGEVLEEQLAYWKRMLTGAPPVIELPTDRPRPAVQNYRGANERFELSVELSKLLRDLSRQEGVTLFMTLLAAFNVLLHRYSHQEDIVVGTPIAGRNRSEIEPLIGFFVNTLALRTRMSGNPKFVELLERVKEATLGAYAHQEMPFEKLVEELEPERSLSHAPLFQVSFVLQNASSGALELPGLTVSNVASQTATAKYDLTVMMFETGDRLSGTFEYKVDLFDPETIRRMVKHFKMILKGAVAKTGQGISELNMLEEEEQKQLLSGFNDTAVEYQSGVPLHELFEKQAAATPGAVALIAEDAQLTYAELNAQANQLAHYLRGKGVGAESVVGLLSNPSSRLVVGMLGILKAGGAYLPLDVEYPRERLALMMKDAGVHVVLTQVEFLQFVETTAAGVDRQIEAVCLDSDWQHIARQPAENMRLPVNDRQNIAYVIYTSGSTGVPKGVAIPHGAISNHMQWMNELWPLSQTDRVLQKTPASFDASVWELYAPLLSGAQLVLAGAGAHRDVKHLLKVISEQHISIIQTVPALLQVMLDEPEFSRSCANVHRWFCGGEPLATELLERFTQRAPWAQLINLYGPTEATIDATYYECGVMPPKGRGVPIGKPISNTQAFVLDVNMRPVPLGVTGELYIGGAGLARGYLYRPELTAERFVPHPFSAKGGERLYRTGDLVRYWQDGELEFVGRADRQVKVRGHRIELGEIEAALGAHEGVREYAVVVSEGKEGDKRLVAYTVNKDESSGKELREYMRGRLPEYMVPSIFVSLEKMPLTPNGKIDRKALQAWEHGLAESRQAFVTPRDELELQLARIWEDVLGVSPVGVKENFFELGGHSLLAVRLISRVQGMTDVQLPLSMLFQEPTVERLATHLRSRERVRRASPLVPINRGGAKPPFFCVHPAGGNVYCYAALARRLGSEQPFYGLQARGLNEGERVLIEVEAMAADYVEALRAEQPEGPYLLGGWSTGGVVAFEMARQLSARGVEVGLLALLDAGVPENYGREATDADREMMASFARDLGLPFDRRFLDDQRVLELSADERLNYVLEQAKAANVLPPDIGLTQLRRLFHVFKTNVRARAAYVPQPYAGRVTLFRADAHYSESEPDTTLGWSEFARGGVELRMVPGTHYSIVRESGVRLLAEQLTELLKAAQTSGKALTHARQSR